MRKPRTNLFASQAQLALVVVLAGASGCVTPGPMPVVIHPRYSEERVAAGSGRSEELSLVTYNIWGLPAWINGVSSKRYTRIAEELRRLDPDLVLLQEVWTRKAFEALPLSGAWSAANVCPACFFRRNGLVVLSRFPIVGGEFYAFHAAAFPDALVTKGALKVTIELADGRRLNVWNVHLQDGGHSRARSRQISELLGWIRQAQDGQLADLVGGDFNCTPDSAHYRQLSSALGQEAIELKGAKHFVTFDGRSENPRRGQTLDYVFIRPGPEVGELHANPVVAFTAGRKQERLSDHFGIQVLLSLGLAPASAPDSGPKALAEAPMRPLGTALEPGRKWVGAWEMRVRGSR